ncbi:hypothetical protein Taro_049203 [Colocasia esculenta]|uniref:Uncharacterized protein n=1 Tax=Colocasia esculenta TaxID=4460 RepID=A0A843XA62_COLES|nr:hypothetical protein [Colocasia esculenta]
MGRSLLTSGVGRRRPCRDGEVRRDPNRCAVFKKVWPNRAFRSSARPGGELLRLLWAIRRSGMVFDALSVRGRRVEWGKCRVMRGFCVLREGRDRLTRHDRVSYRAMSGRCDQKATLSSVATTAE